MNRDISLISCAGSLPENQLSVSCENTSLNVFSAGNLPPIGYRKLWRLNKKENITRLIKNSLVTALQQVNMSVKDLDSIIVNLVWPGNILYEEVILLAKELNISCPIIPVSLGTAGGMTALELGRNQFANKNCNYVAVIAACNYAHWFSQDDPVRNLLSDGAACAILSRDPGMSLFHSHTIQTYNYEPLQLDTHSEYVKYTLEAGEFIFNHLPDTIYNCCYQLCRDAGKEISDIRYFHIYDPTHWVREVSANALKVNRGKIVTIFDKYGSLGPAQNLFALMELSEQAYVNENDLVVLFGFGPAATATSILLSWSNIPFSIQKDKID
ncbi:3-oxoacyl-[acyl-carrier-protein] synthase III C-terminal domain-containing protein [Pectobacterium odoriferum]|uniref:Beta-ketoacyl-[acyl-carrier-protein] synthase III C-terminal domain-containing protein n=1 Tax=Pectobacterium odoriferum TaxID=78398 RepID=A0ABD6VLU3_9GAMM|nr:3-oxoacyl-[acyl-carrier-protein] synthase III C-terminal domain-containing protein [Pectobacterium odoriferum]KGA42330.1 hypothetical protein KU75_06370 [Pectobacterium odoriferum]MBA0190349.1 hypothetical protein [Pectobacterium odoriferum]MCA6963322.1 hypothetical protein [Pectobacterium odoriferum]MCH5011411.1 hypothetical protein [Pectobacterium odoriferum]POD95379.1 hypothetical protein BVY06_13735 [Pectobacterium odoriferum]